MDNYNNPLPANEAEPKKIPTIFDKIFAKIEEVDMERRREYLEVKDQCIAAENRVEQLGDIIEDERQKVT